jgi:hypothetical protein
VDLGGGSLAVKEFQAIDKIDFIAKGINSLDVAVKAFLPPGASILHAPPQAEANCHSRIRDGLAESFPFSRADLFQAALDCLSSAAVRRGIRTSLADKWRGNFLHSAVRQTTAFYIPARNNEQLPSRLWVAFCGNGSLALDWTTILAGYPNHNDAFLLLDYPGYGKCQGYASIASASS